MPEAVGDELAWWASGRSDSDQASVRGQLRADLREQPPRLNTIGLREVIPVVRPPNDIQAQVVIDQFCLAGPRRPGVIGDDLELERKRVGDRLVSTLDRTHHERRSDDEVIRGR